MAVPGTFEANMMILDQLFANTQAVIGVANVRLNTWNQVTEANGTAWQAAYDLAIADGKTPGQAERIADAEAPPITPEQETAVLSGESNGQDVAGVPNVENPEEGLVAVLDSVGARLADPLVPLQEQFEEGETAMSVFTDDFSDGIQRQIILPADYTLEDQGKINDYLTGQDVDDVEEAERKARLAYEDDPLIGIPWNNRDYVANRWATQDNPEGEVRDKFIQSVNQGLRQDHVTSTVVPEYYESDVLDMISVMPASQVFKFQRLMSDAGFYGERGRPLVSGQISGSDYEVIGSAMHISNTSGDPFWTVMQKMADEGLRQKQNDEYNSRGTKSVTGTVKAPFSVPGHLRSIPGEKTVAQETKARFRQEMGRDPLEDELVGIANELTGYYQRSNQEEIALYLAAYNGDNQGLLTGAQMQRIEDPGAATSYDIAETYANEIDLNKRRESNSDSFKRMLNATMGNRVSVGGLTPNMTTIERGR